FQLSNILAKATGYTKKNQKRGLYNTVVFHKHLESANVLIKWDIGRTRRFWGHNGTERWRINFQAIKGTDMVQPFQAMYRL
ncbi:hypothetical protein B5M09_010185, partial [Aphanomyces astaci]